MIFNKHFYTSSSEMLQLNQMPLADFFVCRTIILVFKVLLHGFIANYMEFFKYVKKKTKIKKIQPTYRQRRHNLEYLFLYTTHIYGMIYLFFLTFHHFLLCLPWSIFSFNIIVTAYTLFSWKFYFIYECLYFRYIV